MLFNPSSPGYRISLQAAKAELPAAFLLWRQRQRNTDTDVGSTYCQSAHNCHLEKHQEELCLLANCHHGTPHAYVLYRFRRIYGESGQDMGRHTCKADTESTARTDTFWVVGGLLFRKESQKPVFSGLLARFLCLFLFYRTAII